MSDDIIFARTRWEYKPYIDFWKLVELSDYHWVYVDQMDLSKNVMYIVSPMNGEWKEVMNGLTHNNPKDRKSKLLFWNLERPIEGIGEFTASHRKLIEDGWIDDVIVSDRQFAKDSGFQYIVMGGHSAFAYPGEIESKIYQTIHLACYSLRRQWMFRTPIKHEGYKSLYGCTIAPNGWGQERDMALRQSMTMLNVHQDDTPYLEPLRFMLAAMYGLPVITESCPDLYPYYGFVRTYDSVKDAFAYIHMITQPDYYKSVYQRGVEFRQLMVEKFAFRKCVESVLC